MIAGFHSAGVTDQHNTSRNLCETDTAPRIYEQRSRLGTTWLLPFLVKIQLVCKAWYKGADRRLSL